MLLSEQCQCVSVVAVFFLQLGLTSLHHAVYYNHYNIASALLNWGAEVDAVDWVSEYVVNHMCGKMNCITSPNMLTFTISSCNIN